MSELRATVNVPWSIHRDLAICDVLYSMAMAHRYSHHQAAWQMRTWPFPKSDQVLITDRG
jgi:hypothetical protein